MNTPPGSREGTPRRSRGLPAKFAGRTKAGMSLPEQGQALPKSPSRGEGGGGPGGEGGGAVDLSTDELDGLHYDWQFELLNGLPRDKALALVKLIKNSEHEKVQATALAAKLQREVRELEAERQGTEEQVAVHGRAAGEAPPPAAAAGGARRTWPVLLAAVAALVTVLLVLFGPLAIAPSSSAPLGQEERPAERVTAAATSGAASDAQGRREEGQEEREVEERRDLPSRSSESDAAEAQLAQEAAADVPLVLAAAWRSAVVLGNASVELHHASVFADETAPRDATADLNLSLDSFPGVDLAFRLARLAVARVPDGGEAPVTVDLYVGNDGATAWPDSTSLRLISGPDLGLNELPVGAVAAGNHVELTLHFRIPLDSDEPSVRSAWVLEAAGDPFGPLLLLEVDWM